MTASLRRFRVRPDAMIFMADLCLPAPGLYVLLPAHVIGADPEYLTVQYVGLGIEISVEIFIDRRGVDLTSHSCTIAVCIFK
jgi:hypothetical protein